jgi:serine/threonine protein kinase
MKPVADHDPNAHLNALQTAESVILINGWASQMQVARASHTLSSAEPNHATAIKLGRLLLEQKILTHDQMHQFEQILRQQDQLQGFQLLKKLGSGGMGTVYLAKHLSSGDEVALKVVNSRLADDVDFVNRFQRETKALADLRHQHLANVIDSGACGNTHYLAMEFINGPSLGSLLKEFKALPEPYVLYIVRQVAECLSYVNTQSGLVHRDIKPDNILINRINTSGDMFPDDDIAKLIDFGLVKTGNDDEHLTQTGMTIGTPLYMSPEQVRGEKLDCRSDVYGLGATMFNLLTGQPPYRASSPGAIMSAHLTEPVPDPGELVPSLNSRTRKLVMMSIAKNPEHRFLTFDALIKACDEAIDNIRGKSGGTMRLLRKPLVIKKTPPTRKPGEYSSRIMNEVGEDLPADHSDEAVSNRIRQKHATSKVTTSDSFPVAGQPMKVVAPAKEKVKEKETGRISGEIILDDDEFPDSAAVGSGSSGSRSRPATEALAQMQSAAIKASTLRVVREMITDASGSHAPQVVKTSAVFDEDFGHSARANWIPWAILGVAIVSMVAYSLLM